ncbi:MAG: BREX-1 system adenine-specific DNA-methyltransferase PglX [Firmicutes bacterium]|nr:BREX-1 system adenine-specific DNA-methyltransferase PglX [Bacillota bacterium]
MDPNLKKTLRAITLEIRHILEGYFNGRGEWQPGDLERRLAAIGIRKDRPPAPAAGLSHLTPEDKEARRVVEAYVAAKAEAGVSQARVVEEFLRESAYTWANRLLALRCLEARGIIDEVVLQKKEYGGRSLEHYRLVRRAPERCAGEDEGLYAVLFDAFARLAEELPLLFDPAAPGVALRPSVAALRRCLALLSGTETVRGCEPAVEEIFTAPDALGWAYQYWNTEEKDRIFETLRTRKGFKIEGADIILVTQLYTEPYMVKFLVQNSLGALWMGMYPNSRLYEKWPYYVKEADRAAVTRKPIREITFLDPAVGSGHFLLEAFDLFYAMYLEEGEITEPAAICASILENNLYGIDIDERAVQIAALALYMKAKEKAPDFAPRRVNLVATNIRLPKGEQYLEEFLGTLERGSVILEFRSAFESIFRALSSAAELGTLVQIEEQFAEALDAIRREHEKAIGRPPGSLRHDPWWQKLHADALGRFRAYIEKEIIADDLSARFFGAAAAKGLTLFDLLSRRYDVVATNPPYMGSKNMGPLLKEYLQKNYAPGKRDLYAAFILRCLQLAAEGGRVAMVTQQSWMFLRSFADLRALDDEKLKKGPKGDFPGLLRATTIETLAHLGEHAFDDSSAAGAFVVLFVLAKTPPAPEHRLTAFRLVGPKSAAEKDELLQTGTAGQGDVSRTKQSGFLAIPNTPIVFWLGERIFQILKARPLIEDVAEVKQGLATADDNRFLRYFWECPSCNAHRWFPFCKGGGFSKWFGLNLFSIRWDYGGSVLRNVKSAVIRNPEYYFRQGYTYTGTARGSFALRYIDGNAIFGHRGPMIFVIDNIHENTIFCIGNSRVVTYLLRAISPSLCFEVSQVNRVPILFSISNDWGISQFCLNMKQKIVSLSLCERSFSQPDTYLYGDCRSCFGSFKMYLSDFERYLGAVSSLLHTAEGLNELYVMKLYDVFTDNSLQSILAETGTPAGWFPLIAGYDALPELPEGLPEIPPEVIEYLKNHERRTLTPEELTDLKRRLRALYEAGPGAKVEEEEPFDDDEAVSEDNEDEENKVVLGARIPIPTETFLEELSVKLEIHPISVYWLLKELREKEGVVCLPELRRYTTDYFTVMILRLLGHRWPKQIEAGEPVPEWAEPDGIIPLTEGAGKPTLIERVRERIAADFGEERVSAIEREFAEIMGKPLEEWLAKDFFKHHTSQFKKRPIAWQIESRPNNNEKVMRSRRKGLSLNRTPAFSCLVYYHALGADLLPKLCSQYVGPLRLRLETELHNLERVERRTPDQEGRRLLLERQIEELKAFEQKLQAVAAEGFTTPSLSRVVTDDALQSLTRAYLARASEAAGAVLPEWKEEARAISSELAEPLEEAITCLAYHCAKVAPQMKVNPSDPLPDANALRETVFKERERIIKDALALAYTAWEKAFKQWKTQRRKEAKEAGLKPPRFDDQDRLAARLARKMTGWLPPDLDTWREWGLSLPIYDEFCRLTEHATTPAAPAEFLAQERRYAPDINDGVRVNIAPLQKAGLLASEVLPAKDQDKAIADRAVWRADERRWCREGKLPRPGWWPV